MSGSITYSGTVQANDVLIIAVFLTPDMEDTPIDSKYIRPNFPQSYSFVDFNDILDNMGLTEGEFYINAVFDVNGDMADEPGPEDIFGIYTTDGQNMAPVTITKGQMTTDIDIPIGNWSP